MSEVSSPKISKFLSRLYDAVNDELTDYISWNEQGDRIRINDKDMFIKHTLSKLSKTKEFSAFLRQLNFYGFIKIKTDKSDEVEEYYNRNFKRGSPELLVGIKRVKRSHLDSNKMTALTLENSISYLTNANFKLNSEIMKMKERLDKQDRTIDGLLDILGKVFTTGAQSVKFRTDNLSNIDKTEYNLYTKDFLYKKPLKGLSSKDEYPSSSPKLNENFNDMFF